MATIGKIVLTAVLLGYIVWRILIIFDDKKEEVVEETLKVNKIVVSVIGDKCDDGNQNTTIDLFVDTKETCKGM